MLEKELVLYESPFIVELIKRVKTYNMPSMHYHDHLEIYYMLSGERYYCIKDSIYHVKKGDLVLIGENELHKTMQASTAYHERILINFKKEQLDDMPINLGNVNIMSCFKRTAVLRLTVEEQKFVEHLLIKMIRENQLQSKGYTIYMKLLLAELMLFFLRHDESPPDMDDFESLDPLQKKIREIVQFLNMNFMEKITLESLSEKYFMSYHYLSRSFRAATGFTFIEYLNRIRIEKAQKLLRDTNQNIACISDKVGFGSVTHFERNFKLLVGVSPLRYRKLKSNLDHCK